MNHTRRTLFTGALLLGAALATGSAAAQNERSFSQNELVTSGHQFFGNVSRGFALTVEEAVRRWGEPNGYVLGQEASGAFVGGLRFGEGTLYTRNAGDMKVYWQGPTLGWDFGGDGAHRRNHIMADAATQQCRQIHGVQHDGFALFAHVQPESLLLQV